MSVHHLLLHVIRSGKEIYTKEEILAEPSAVGFVIFVICLPAAIPENIKLPQK